MKPVCHIVAGPNGSGKSTFALNYLPEYAGSIEYVNPDLMAQGLSPTDITLSSLKAGKLTLKRIADLIGRRVSFGFESTLSGRGHLKLEADRRQALEDDLSRIARGRGKTGEGKGDKRDRRKSYEH